ncbi:MAG: hypothetical protein A2V21_307345 [Deltaproteobacteria bacterium GWC2_55_46]|nr:MAG: hypothetical protein A3I81_03770 [Deltaproteobacteria bacterium RIFCSPLOWO2_02_FULL_55_12]OIJ74093.1 MAG: hypothetical protein A2V21_307345 [Deltaproteobacteria bacterium GWC2_55_46]
MPLEKKIRTSALAAALLSAIIAFAVYAPSLGNGFVNWDDPEHVYENPYIRALDLKAAFTSITVGNWLPLTLLSYTLDFAIWGNKPFGFHLTNSILHALNTALVFLVSFRLASARKGLPGVIIWTTALAAALLFGVHPTHVESVAWISERKDLLCAFFFLLTISAYLRYAATQRGVWYISALVLFALALMSKPMAVTIPAVLLIIDLFPLDRLRGRLIKAVIEKAPFIALSAASAITTILVQKSAAAVVSLDSSSVWQRGVTAVRGVGFYIFKTIYPAGLAPYYPMAAEPFDISFYASAALIMTVSIVSVLALRRTKAPATGWLYYLVTLLPVIGLVQVGSQAAADRYTYLPMLGLYLLAGAGAGTILHKLHKTRAAFYAALAVMLAILVALSAVTVRQTGFWKDSIALWNRQIELYPGKVVHSYNMRGLALDEAGRHREAIDDFNVVISINPKDAYALNNRAGAYGALGEFDKAIDDLMRAIPLLPGKPEPWVNLAAAYSNIGKDDLAFEARQRAEALGWRPLPR